MSLYSELFTVSVNHTYFSDGHWRDLEFIPAAETRKIVTGAGILLRNTVNGMAAFYDEQRRDVLRLFAKGEPLILRFTFKVYAKDRSFENYTEIRVRRQTSVLSLARAVASGETVPSGEAVTDADFVSLDGLIADGILDNADRAHPPDFIITAMVDPINAQMSAQGIHVTFGAREAFWKYHFLGAKNRDIYVADMDNQVEFSPCEEAVLPGNRPARVFRSTRRLPVQERSNFRFQLREGRQGAGKVLLKRLPVASESRLGHDIIDGNNEIVLESYVNL